MTRLNQGLFSTTMEAEKRDPGNEIAGTLARCRCLSAILGAVGATPTFSAMVTA